MGSERIVIGGFSQGGTATILAGLMYPKKIGGVVSISGWGTYRNELASRVTEANKALPVLYCYGDDDPVTDPSLAKASIEALKPLLGDSLTVLEGSRSMHQPS